MSNTNGSVFLFSVHHRTLLCTGRGLMQLFVSEIYQAPVYAIEIVRSGEFEAKIGKEN